MVSRVRSDTLRALAAGCPRLSHLSVTLPSVSDDLVEALSRFPYLNRVMLGPPPTAGVAAAAALTDQGMQYLTRIHSLKHLNVFQVPNLKAASLQSVAQLTSLTELSLIAIPFNSDALLLLTALHKLQQLTLAAVGLDNASLEPIVRSNPHIWRLSCPRSKLHSTEFLTCLKSLSSLDISLNPQLDDAALLPLAALPMATLNICHTKITGVGFAGAKYIPTLTSLLFGKSAAGMFPQAHPPSDDNFHITTEGAHFIVQFTRQMFPSDQMHPSHSTVSFLGCNR